MNETTTADRCRGVLLGLAAGDRNGGPIRMAVRLAESLLELGRFDPADIVGRYLRWWREGAFDTGPVSGRALELMAAGMSSSAASAQVHRESGGKTAGCNPAHRSSPLAMLAALADEALPGSAITEARLTHHDPLAGDVTVAVTALCRCLIRGTVWESAFQRSAEGRQTQTSEALLSGQDGPGTSGGFAPEVLRAAGTLSARLQASPRRWGGRWPSPGLPITARSSWGP